MKLSNQGIDLIKNFEGLRLNAYCDAAGIWTIGYGSTMYPDGRAVKFGDKLATEPQAGTLLGNTLGRYEGAVNNYVKVLLNQNQFDALVSFAYNAGTGALKESTLLKKLNERDFPAAADQFLAWDKITNPQTGEKQVCDTLASRRKAERQLFLKSP
jgi:lysozyme